MSEIKTYKRKKQSSKKRGIEFALSLEEYTMLRKIKTCFYTGILLNHSENCNQEFNTWTLDRVDNSIGYHINNVVVSSYMANQIKCKYLESNTTTDINILKTIIEKITLHNRVTIKKESKLQRIWKILTE